MERKISFKKYLLAFILTLLVFSGGILIGVFLENARLGDAKQGALEQKVALQSLQLQRNYIDSGISDCKTLNKVLEENLNELVRQMSLVNDYETKSLFNEAGMQLQRREYFLTEMQYLLTSKEIDKKCTKDSIKIVYFYDDSKFDTQGDILGYLKNLFGSNLLIFSFDSEFKKEPMINILLTYYGVIQFPTVIVEDKVIQGHTSVELLKKEICSSFEKQGIQKPAECKT